MDTLTFAELREPNVRRCNEYFKTCADWTPADWMTALTGEQGELANLLKKIRRGDFTLEEKREEVAKEIADVAIYLDLLASKLGIDLGKAVREKFNEVSDRRNCDIKL
jgi:NTP pyrophosphatase (non-canonical NTP hydrolase)